MTNIEGQRFIITWFQRIFKGKEDANCEKKACRNERDNNCAKWGIPNLLTYKTTTFEWTKDQKRGHGEQETIKI